MPKFELFPNRLQNHRHGKKQTLVQPTVYYDGVTHFLSILKHNNWYPLNPCLLYTSILSDKNKLYNKIISYTRYVYDTFSIFGGTLRQIDGLLTFLNGINSNIEFTMEVEYNNCLLYTSRCV